MPTKVCPHCQVEIGGDVAQCPHCQRVIENAINPYQSPVEISLEKLKRTWTWTLLFSGVFIAIALLPLLVAPGLTIALLLWSIPTTVRSVLIQRKLIQLHGEVSFQEEMQTCFASAFTILAMYLGGFVACMGVFGLTTLVLLKMNPGEVPVANLDSPVGIIGEIAGLITAGGIAWNFWWPRKWTT